MKKSELNTDTIYAFRSRSTGYVRPARVISLNGTRFLRDGWIDVQILESADPTSKVVRIEQVDNGRPFLGTWADHEVALKEQRDREYAQAQDKRRGVEESEKARKELATLWPNTVEVDNDFARQLLFEEHSWSPRDDGALRVTLDIHTLLALVKAARKEALDEFSGEGGRYERVVDHG